LTRGRGSQTSVVVSPVACPAMEEARKVESAKADFVSLLPRIYPPGPGGCRRPRL